MVYEREKKTLLGDGHAAVALGGSERCGVTAVAERCRGGDALLLRYTSMHRHTINAPSIRFGRRLATYVLSPAAAAAAIAGLYVFRQTGIASWDKACAQLNSKRRLGIWRNGMTSIKRIQRLRWCVRVLKSW